MRDGAVFGEKVLVEAKGDWSYTWTELPKYKADGSGAESVYSVVETEVPLYDKDDSVSTKLTAEENAIEITNTYIPETIEIAAEKSWQDNSNHYGLRPESVKLTLQASLVIEGSADDWTEEIVTVENVPTPAEDDGTVIYTTSALTQEITGEGDIWNGAKWENLPKHVLDAEGKSRSVKYRVVELEEDVPYSYTGTASEGSVEDAKLTVVNTLETTRWSVKKQWQPTEELL
jgi:hypothetical protein